MDWSHVLCSLRPGEAWRLDDCADLGTLTWLDSTEPPSREAIEAHWELMQAGG